MFPCLFTDGEGVEGECGHYQGTYVGDNKQFEAMTPNNRPAKSTNIYAKTKTNLAIKSYYDE